MSDKGWLCVICGHFIQQALPSQILAEGGRAHTYCVEVQEATEERIIKLLQAWGEEAGCYCCASDAAARDIIELIKGEQK